MSCILLLEARFSVMGELEEFCGVNKQTRGQQAASTLKETNVCAGIGRSVNQRLSDFH